MRPRLRGACGVRLRHLARGTILTWLSRRAFTTTPFDAIGTAHNHESRNTRSSSPLIRRSLQSRSAGRSTRYPTTRPGQGRALPVVLRPARSMDASLPHRLLRKTVRLTCPGMARLASSSDDVAALDDYVALADQVMSGMCHESHVIGILSDKIRRHADPARVEAALTAVHLPRSTAHGRGGEGARGGDTGPESERPAFTSCRTGYTTSRTCNH